MRSSRFGVVGPFLFAVAVTALLLHLWQSQLIAPSGAGATAFSEEHAFATLSGLLKEQRPHTAGSPENAVVRDRIIAELESAGYAPEVQAVLQCDTAPRNPGCTAVENIVAVHKGTGDGKAVLASAHYDSVPAGPGVSDDGAGVAVVLELARAFSARTTRNDVIFLTHRRRGDGPARCPRLCRTPSADAPYRGRREFRSPRWVRPEHDVRNGSRQRATDESLCARRRAAVGQFGQLRSLQIAAQRHGFFGLSKAGFVRLQFRVLEFGFALSLGPRQSPIHRPSIAAARRRARIRGDRRSRRRRSRNAECLVRCQFLRHLRARHRGLAGRDQCADRAGRAAGHSSA